MQQVEIHVAVGATTLARLAADGAVLDDDEQGRAARFRFDADRTVYRAAHVLLRRALSRRVPLPPARWRFIRTDCGRPEIDTRACPPGSGLRFNLTHTRGLVCCALTQGAAVGIDAECHRPIRDRRALAERFFAADEAAAVAAAGAPGSAAEAATFYALWTLKEAYVKAVGRGLSMGLDGFAFGFSGGSPSRVRLRVGDAFDDRTEHWRCLLLRLDAGPCTLAAVVPADEGARFEVVRHGGGPGPELAASSRGAELSPVQVVAAPGVGRIE